MIGDLPGVRKMCFLVLAQSNHSNTGCSWWKMMLRILVDSIVVAESVGCTMWPVFVQSLFINFTLSNCSPLILAKFRYAH